MSSRNHAAAAARREAAEQERTELRAALSEERRGYVQRGLPERVEAVDAQLRALGPTNVEASTTTMGRQVSVKETTPAGDTTARGRGSAKKAADEAAKQKAAKDEAAAAAAAEEAARQAAAATAGNGPAPTGTQAANGPQNATGDPRPGDPATGQGA